MKFSVVLILLAISTHVRACDLCAVYRAADGNGANSEGFVFSVAQQFVPYRNVQLDGEEINVANPDYVNSAITHFVAGYNFSSRWGISLNVPLVHLNFKRTDLRYSLTAPPSIYTEKGTDTGLGDVSLIGRYAIIRKAEMTYSFVVNLLGGVKFPTGNDDRLEDEIEQTRIYDAFVPPGTPHDPLGHSIASVHQHSLSFGSGSFDGIFGLTMNGNWRRLLFNGQFQYYLRTEGDSGFEYGDELMISGGPGIFVLLDNKYSLSLQANAVYDEMEKDELLGRSSDRTGSTSWYLGPLINFTWSGKISANVGVDVPLQIDNHGYQSVPEYRIHGGFSWQF